MDDEVIIKGVVSDNDFFENNYFNHNRDNRQINNEDFSLLNISDERNNYTDEKDPELSDSNMFKNGNNKNQKFYNN